MSVQSPAMIITHFSRGGLAMKLRQLRVRALRVAALALAFVTVSTVTGDQYNETPDAICGDWTCANKSPTELWLCTQEDKSQVYCNIAGGDQPPLRLCLTPNPPKTCFTKRTDPEVACIGTYVSEGKLKPCKCYWRPCSFHWPP